MKKIYLFLGITAFAGSVIAQGPANSMNYPKLKSSKTTSFAEENTTKPGINNTEKGITLWSNTCSDAADWTLTNSSIPAIDWSIETDPMAIPVSALSPMASTTANDGFLFINSDGVGGGDGDGTPIVCEATISLPTGLLAAEPYVTLKFQHNYRWWQDARGVRISVDGGANWTDYPMTYTGSSGQTFANGDPYPGDQNSSNPQVELINISAIAGNANDLMIQFYYNDDDIWAWYWAVDDVEIVQTDEFDLAMADLYWGSVGTYGARLPYYQIPVEQIAPIDISGIVTNYGFGNQTDVVFTATETTSSFTGNSVAAPIATFATDTFDLASQFTPAGLGNYSINGEVGSSATDALPVDNTLIGAANFEVGNLIYARDMGTVTGGTLNRDADGFAAPYEVGNVFDMVATASLGGVEFYVNSATDAESDVYVNLYEIDAATGDFIFIDGSTIGGRILSADDFDTWITLPFENGYQTLNAGTTYLIVAGSQGGIGTNGFVTGTSGESEAQTSFYLDLIDGTWYYTTSTPMVRMNFDPTVGIENNTSNVSVSIYPNPAKDFTTVSYELSNNSDVKFTLTDLSGKVVFSKTEENAKAGKHTMNIETAELANGVYTYSISLNGVIASDKIVISK